MSYYQALGLTREPFSNSPDPDMLYRSRTHLECLQHMEIAVRLRRGLNVVLGEVGTGKTTLSRELIRVLAQEGDIEAYLLDDPYCPSTTEFLLSLARLVGLDTANQGRDAALLKDALKAELLARGQNGGRTVALVVDEGQKITPECLELLRELLNFETNAHKLLQIVIFAQTEFEEILHERPNLEDRVNFLYRLTPLDRVQTRRMIETRLLLCSPDGKAPPVFTRLALRRIHKLTGGYPRKIVRLCHLSMLLAVGFGKRRIGWGLVGRASRESLGVGRVWLRRLVVVGAAGSLTALLLHFAGPALPDARQAALDALGRMQTSLSSKVFEPAAVPGAPAPGTAAVDHVPAPAAPVAPKAVAEVPACEEALGLTASTPAPAASPAVAKTAAPAKKSVETAVARPAAPVGDKAVAPAPQVAPARPEQAVAAIPSHAAPQASAPQAEPALAGTVAAEAQITKAAAAAATKAPVQAAVIPAVRAETAALAPTPAPAAAAANAPAPAVVPPVPTPAPVATAPAFPAVAPLAEPVALVRSHGLGRPEPAAPRVPAASAAAALPAAAPQTPAVSPVQSAAPVLAAVPAAAAGPMPAPAAIAQTPAPAYAPAATAPIAPAQAAPYPADVAPRPSFAPAVPAQGLGAALALAAAALPPEPVDQVIVVSPEYASALQATPAAAPAAAAPALPAILGETTVPSGWAVTRQAARVYGHARRSVMTRIAKVNPGMDFNRVRAGDPIVFPTIPADPLPQGACLIRVGMVESLEKGFAIIGQQREADPILSLYCTAQPGGGLHFDLVLANVFPNRQDAEIALAGLPRQMAATAVVVDGYPVGTTALTDVSLWPGHPGAQKIAAPARSGGRQVAVSGPARQDMLP